MDPILTLAVASSRRADMERSGATERLAAQLRAVRPRRTTLAGVGLAALLGRLRDTASPSAEPCPTC